MCVVYNAAIYDELVFHGARDDLTLDDVARLEKEGVEELHAKGEDGEVSARDPAI